MTVSSAEETGGSAGPAAGASVLVPASMVMTSGSSPAFQSRSRDPARERFWSGLRLLLFRRHQQQNLRQSQRTGLVVRGEPDLIDGSVHPNGPGTFPGISLLPPREALGVVRLRPALPPPDGDGGWRGGILIGEFEPDRGNMPRPGQWEGDGRSF